MKQSKVIVVDDSDLDRKLLSEFLKRKGYEVLSLASGIELASLIQKEKPGLVLLDVMMPDRNGTEILRELREQWSEIELPVIMITAKSDAGDIVESLRFGANDYVVKPVNFEVTLHRVRAHLKIAELAKQASMVKELQAVSALIATYNHEVNNPLAIALGLVSRIAEKYPNESDSKKLEAAIWRVANIVKKINEVAVQGSLEYEDYTAQEKMVKIK